MTSAMSDFMAALYGVEPGSSKAFMYSAYRGLKQYAEGIIKGEAPDLTALDGIASDFVQLMETTRAELAASGEQLPDRCGLAAPFGGTCLLPAEHPSVHQAHVVWVVSGPMALHQIEDCGMEEAHECGRCQVCRNRSADQHPEVIYDDQR